MFKTLWKQSKSRFFYGVIMAFAVFSANLRKKKCLTAFSLRNVNQPLHFAQILTEPLTENLATVPIVDGQKFLPAFPLLPICHLP